MKCYACGNEITVDNWTDEHIIINAAGGRLKSKDLICVKCNIEFGEGIDAALASQLNNIASFLMIKRERGSPQPIVTERASTGEKYLLEVGGTPKSYHPKVEIKKDGDVITNISISARTQKEFETIVKGLAKKDPRINIDNTIKAAKTVIDDFDEPLHFTFEVGGRDVFRAICKCAINYFVFKKGDISQINHLIPYIKGSVDKNIVWMHYKDDLYNLEEGECFHVIHLRGNKVDKTLYCYIEYFNGYKFLVLLNDSYDGNEIKETYCFDVLSAKIIEKEISVEYNKEALLDFFINRETIFFDKITKSLNHAISIGYERQTQFQFKKAWERGIQNSYGKYKNGTIITEEMANEAMNEILKEIQPLLLRQLKMNRKNMKNYE